MENALATGRDERTSDHLSESGPPLVAAVLEDDGADAELLIRMLGTAWHTRVDVRVFDLLSDLEDDLGLNTPDVVFCDLSVPDGHGIDVVERVISAAARAPVVVFTSSPDPRLAELALCAGAQDYLTKGSFDGETLARTLRYSIARRSAEVENQRIAADLAQLCEELDQYVGIVAHDLRAPVRTARLFADRMTAAAEKQQDASAMAGALDSSLARLELMIDRLLRLGALRDTAPAPIAQPLPAIVEYVQNELVDEIQATGTSIRCDDDGLIYADPVLVRELLVALVENSIKYRDPTRTPAVSVAVSQLGRFDRLIVSDNGLGIGRQHWKQAFRLFERVNTISGDPGLGFGLAFCQRVAELHHGSIEFVEPEGAIGASLCVSLPAEPRSD